MNKIFANMMQSCSASIRIDQVHTLADYRDTPAEFDSTQGAYFELLEYNLDKYLSGTEEENAAAIQMD